MTWWRTSRRFRGHARTVRGVHQTKSPRGCLFLRESKREREEEDLGRVGEEKGSLLHLHPTAWGPPARDTHRQSAEPSRTVREVRGRSAHPGADGPLFAPEHLVLLLFPTSRADGPRCPGGQSARSGRTVRPTAVDGLTSLFNFSLIYLEIKICKGIFWDHCSRIMKETCHMMQCTN
jgi:hypothetical protein